MGQHHSTDTTTRTIVHDHSMKSFSEENLTWCGQQWKLNAINSSPPVISDTDADKAVSSSTTSLRTRVWRAWSSRDLLERLSKVNVRPLATRRAQPHKVLSSFEPITEFQPPPPQQLTASDSVCQAETEPSGRTVGDVLRQTVDFLVYEVEPVLIAEHVRRSRRSSPCRSTRWSENTSPLLMSTEQLRRLLTDIITDAESDEFATFCRLLRKLDTERRTAEFLEALDLVLKVVAGCTCRCCLADDDDDDCGWSWDVQVVYADCETRSQFDYGDVESIKRCRRRKSRLMSQQRRPAVVLRDSADRFVPMLSVKLCGRVFCEPIARRFERLLDQFSCVRHLALPNCRLDPPTVVRLSRVLQLNTGLYSLDLAGTRLADDGAMLLTHALQRNSSLRMIALTGNELTSRACRLLVRAIARSRAVTELDLSDNCIGDSGCRALGELLASASCPLRRLLVCNNQFGTAGASALFSALRRNSRLTHLEVSHNEIGDDSSPELSTTLIYNRTLRHLALSGCHLTSATCRLLARPLQTNSVLLVLMLDDNEQICDAGVEVLADSLRYNRSVRQLSLSHCSLTLDALNHVLSALRYNSTITRVDLRPSAASPSNDDRSHGDVTSSPTAELSRVLRANPLLRILV